MNKKMNVKTLVLALGLLSLPSLAQAEFVRGMTQQQLNDEISAQTKAGVSLEKIAEGVNLAQAGFVRGMSPQQMASEIDAQLKAGISLVKIAMAANRADLKPDLVTEFLIKAGQSPAAVVTAILTVNPAAAEAVTTVAVSMAPADQAAAIAAAGVTAAPGHARVITQAAIAAAPAQSKAINTAVLAVPGVNPADILSATASGSVSDKARERVNRGSKQDEKRGSGGGFGYGHCKKGSYDKECASPS